jgi:hypothetical protein
MGAYSIFNLLFKYLGANVDIHFIQIERDDSILSLQSIIAASDGVRP